MTTTTKSEDRTTGAVINQSTPQYWDSMVGEFDAIYSGQGRTPVGVLMDKWLRKDIYDRVDMTAELANSMGKNLKVLDVGTGTGRLIVPLGKSGHYTVGVDFSEDMLASAKEIVEEAGVAHTCEFIKGDLLNDVPEELKKHEQFDLVALLGILEYMADTTPMLEKAASFKPKKIIGSFPREGSARAFIRRARYKVQGLDCPLYFFTPEQVRELGKKIGAVKTDVSLLGELYMAVYHFE